MQEIVDKINEQNPGIVIQDASTLLEFMQAEVVTSLPNLGNPVADIDAEQIKKSLEIPKADNLDNFLFIGDSITVRLQNYGSIKANNCKYVAESGINVVNWTKKYLNDASLPSNSEINGICIMLGVNNLDQANDLIELSKKLHERYPNKPIFIEKVLPVNPNVKKWGATNPRIDNFNAIVQNFCTTEGASYNVQFIDVSEGLVDSDGNLSAAYTTDGLHPEPAGGKILANNINNAVVNASAGIETSKNVKDRVEEKLESMTLEEKVSQMFMVMTSSGDELKQNAGGYVLTWSDFSNVKSAIDNSKSSNDIPAIYATDDEGGQVQNAAKSGDFPSAKSYGDSKNYTQLETDEKRKAEILLEKGINLNLAPVADLSSPSSYMGKYERSFGTDVSVTSGCVETVVNAMNSKGLSTCLKHFPGYGNNENTHTGIATDKRDYSKFKDRDLKVFEAGIKAGAPTIMVSHNIMECKDDKLPASLSPEVHKIIRQDLDFDGVVMTDDLGMQAIGDNYSDIAVKAVEAGNDMLMTSKFEEYKKDIINAVKSGKITEKRIDESVKRILTWKYKYGIMDEKITAPSTDEPLELAPLGDNPFQGSIQIKRVTPYKAKGQMEIVEGTEEVLSFVEQDVFEALVARKRRKSIICVYIRCKKTINCC